MPRKISKNGQNEAPSAIAMSTATPMSSPTSTFLKKIAVAVGVAIGFVYCLFFQF